MNNFKAIQPHLKALYRIREDLRTMVFTVAEAGELRKALEWIEGDILLNTETADEWDDR